MHNKQWINFVIEANRKCRSMQKKSMLPAYFIVFIEEMSDKLYGFDFI